MTELLEKVRDYWEKGACGTQGSIVGNSPPNSADWFHRVEEHRYRMEPLIHEVARFTDHRGKRVLEIGVGAGTDHVQWARAGADCYGIDLTDRAIETTRSHLDLHGLGSQLQRANAEQLPFTDEYFDVVYSWGVLHHTERPEKAIHEVHRVLREGGEFIGMMYHRRSLLAFRTWLAFGPLRGKPLRSIQDVLWKHLESEGTKAYLLSEVRAMFAKFPEVQVEPRLTSYDTVRIPPLLSRFFPESWGWFLTITATK